MEKKTVKIGVMGAGRGMTMANYCKAADNVELVAVCDNYPPILDRAKKKLEGLSVSFYDNFDDFIQHDMDAVVLANYANDHAPYAIRSMRAGKHVFSEVLPCHTMKQAVELVEAVEETGKIYAYGENYCFFPCTLEMRRRYRAGELGEIEYAEGEYLHNCEKIWPQLTYGDPNHWRNNMFPTFYCTHSLGPIIHITGLRPVKVVGFEQPITDRNHRTGRKHAYTAIEMVTLENGALVKSIHGDLAKDDTWYTIYGTKGRLESARRVTELGGVHRLYVDLDEYVGQENPYIISYKPHDELSEKALANGHSGGDFYTMYNFIDRILGNEAADVIGVYEALDMYLPGIFAYRSILNNNIAMEIPNLRDKAVRDQYRNDTMCTIPEIAGDQLIPCHSTGNTEYPPEVYENMKRKFEESLK